MTISALPSPPLRTDQPADFIAKADAFMSALPAFQVQANETAAAMNLAATNATSATTLTIATGAVTLTTQASKSYQVGMSVKIASTANGANWMLGDVTAYNFGTGSLTVQVSHINGSGAGLSAWTISQSAPKGAAPGANVDITSLSGLTTPLSVAQGGCGSTGGNVAKAVMNQAYLAVNYPYTVTSNVGKVVDASHNRVAGDKIWLQKSTGGLPSGSYTVTSVTATEIIFSVVTADTSGNVIITAWDQIYGCTIEPISTSVSAVTFNTPMPNLRYAVIVTGEATGVNIYNRLTTGFMVNISVAEISIVVF